MICHYCRKPLPQSLALPIKVAGQTVFMHKDCLFQFADGAEKIEHETQCNRAGQNVEKLTGVGFHGFPQLADTIPASLPRR